MLDAWQESPFYSERERAALLWTEAVTLVAAGHVRDAVYEAVLLWFTDSELINLTIAVATINAWNRLRIALWVTPGTYQPQIPTGRLQPWRWVDAATKPHPNCRPVGTRFDGPGVGLLALMQDCCCCKRVPSRTPRHCSTCPAVCHPSA
jgi:hypothetical protein